MPKLFELSANDTCGVIVHDEQWGEIAERKLWVPEKIVWLVREDAFEQAASCYVQHIKDGEGFGATHWQQEVAGDVVELSVPRLIGLWHYLRRERAKILEAFQFVPSICVSYESLLESGHTTAKLAAFFGVEVKQPTTVESKWKHHVTNEKQAREEFMLHMKGIV
jgi:hypothetical protein